MSRVILGKEIARLAKQLSIKARPVSGQKAKIALNVFFDSSALAKRYVEEKGSDRVDAILSAAAALSVSVICLPEVVSALCRRRRERRLSKEEYVDAKRTLLFDLEGAR